MTDLKFIVTELNKLLKTDYNLISFDSLPIANLVQLLVDVLHDFGATTKVNYIALANAWKLVASDILSGQFVARICQNLPKKGVILIAIIVCILFRWPWWMVKLWPQFDVKESDPDFTKNRILEALNRIQYHRVEQNYAALARKILIGDKVEIYAIFQFIFTDSEKNRNAVYLSKWVRGLNYLCRNYRFFLLKTVANLEQNRSSISLVISDFLASLDTWSR